jgi:hypothetical protein
LCRRTGRKPWLPSSRTPVKTKFVQKCYTLYSFLITVKFVFFSQKCWP